MWLTFSQRFQKKAQKKKVNMESHLSRRIASLAARDGLSGVPTAADWDPAAIQPPKPIDGYICTAVGSEGFDGRDTGGDIDLNERRHFARQQGTGPFGLHSSAWPTCDPGPHQMPVGT